MDRARARGAGASGSSRKTVSAAIGAGAVALAIAGSAAALNAVPEHSFEAPAAGPTATPTGWTRSPAAPATYETYFGASTAQKLHLNQSFLGEWHNTANSTKAISTSTLTRAVSTSGWAGPVRARLTASYRRTTSAATATAPSLTISLKQGTSTLATAVNAAPLGVTDAGWTTGTAVALLSPDSAYAVEVSFAGSLAKSIRTGAYVDDVRVHASPAAVTAAPVAGSTSVALSWSVVDGTPALRTTNPFRVYRGTASGAAGALAYASSAAYADATTAGNTRYYYEVTDHDADEVESPPSIEVSVLTCPAAPGTPAFSGTTAGGTTLTWAAPAGGASAYAVERAPDVSGSPGAWAEIAAGETTTSFADAGLTGGTKYWYRVRASNASGYGAYSANASVTTPAPALPGTPGTPAFSNVTAATLRVSWGAASGAVTYAVERATAAGGPFTAVATAVATTSYDDAGPLAGNTTYWYRVRATNGAGTGAYSAASSVLTLPAAPGAISFSNVTATGARVAWTASAGGAASYRVERALDASGAPGAWAQVAAGVASPWDDAGLAAGTRYWYRVVGTNASGEGAPSAHASVTTPAAASPVVPGALTATADSCTQVTVRAAFTGDSDGDSTVAIARGSTSSGPWTAVAGCAGLAGASPRTCVDGGVTTGTSYYRATFSDPDNAPAPAPVVSSAVAVPVCGATVTLSDPGPQPAPRTVAAGSSGAAALRVRLTTSGGSAELTAVKVSNLGTAAAQTDVSAVQIWVDAGTLGSVEPGTDTLLGTATWSAAESRWIATGFSHPLPAATSRNLLVAVSFAAGATVGRTFDAAVAAAGAVVASPSTSAGAEVSSGGTITIGAAGGSGSTNANAPMATILNPATGSAVSGAFRFQVQVHDRAGLGAVTVVASADDGATWPFTLTRSTRYSVGSNAAVYETQLTLAPGSYTLRARASNASLSAMTSPVVLKVNPAGRGGGTLLVRDNSSQLCTDCHALASHTSQSTSGKYGSWATGCRDCHTPHGTSNVYLINKEITPPTIAGAPGGYQPARKVSFSNTTGYVAGGGASDPARASFVNDDRSGPCQVCHTRTVRFTNSGAIDASHTGNCVDCHKHTSGFKGDGTCATCHLAAADVDSWTWDGTKATVSDVEWTGAGHGRTTAYPSSNAGAAFDGQGAAQQDRGCAYCHTTAVPHADANYARLANTDKGVNGPCLVCHSSTYATGYDPDDAATDYAAKNGKDVGKEHYGAKHGGANQNGGARCWDCHDPHGDVSAASNPLWYMVQRRPVEHRDAAALPQTLAAAIEFRPAVGGTTTVLDYADYVGGGLCRNCHDASAVLHYTKTTSDGHNLAAATPAKRCTDCHRHQNGFQASCNTCHAAPPSTGKHARHYGVAAVPSSYTDATSLATATQYGFACAKCHSGTHLNNANAGTLADPNRVEVKFDAWSPTPPAAYAAGTAQTPDQLAGGEYFAWSGGTCSSTYCHSNGSPLGGTASYASPTWTQATATTCTSCHAAGGATTTLSRAHQRHTGSYGYGCVRCHAATVSGNTTVSDRRNHVNRVKDIAFDASGPNNSGASYAPATYACSNTYCHSDGQDRAAPYASPASIAWNATSTCRSCHGGDATGTPAMGSGKHASHVNNAAVIGTNYGCVRCHAATVSSNTVVSSTANHVNGAANVQLAAGSYSAGTCSTNECHASGGAGSAKQYYDVAWSGAALDCRGCHGRYSTPAFTSVAGEPNYANGVSPNGHQKHVTSAADCGKCHAGTTTVAGTAILGGSALHTNGVRDVQFSAAIDTNGATSNYSSGTCSAVSCHGSGTPKWGDSSTIKCGDCHLKAADVNDWVYGNGVTAALSNTEWTARGHGQTAIGFGTTNPCRYCHTTTVNHGVATNPFRLVSVGNDVCLACHRTGSTGYDPDGAGTAYVLKNGAKKIGAHHAGAKVGSSRVDLQACKLEYSIVSPK